MKKLVGGIVVAAVLLTAGAAAACDYCGWGHGSGPHRRASSAAMTKFHKETLALRDDLAAREVSLAEEYDKAEPSASRIAAIRKEMVDLEAKLGAAAEKHGVGTWGRGSSRGMMRGGNGHCGCW